MRYQYIKPDELSHYSKILTHVESRFVLRLVVGFLKRIRHLLGFPLYVRLPDEVVQNQNHPEQLRALRVVKRLQQSGYIEDSKYLTNHFPDEPSACILIHTLTKDHGFGWSGKAAHTSDKSYLLWPALGEAVERYSLRDSYSQPGDLIRVSYKELKRAKVDIFALASFTTNERQQSTAPYRLDFTTDDQFTWVPVNQVGSTKKIYAPWQWFSFSHLTNEVRAKKSEALLTPPITTGAAAGQTMERATLAGLLEVIERDAFIIYWLQQVQAKQINIDAIENTEIQELVQLAKDYRLELHILYLQTDVPVHTISLVMLDRSSIGPAVTVGAKTGFDLTTMIIDVLQDQLAQRGLVYNMKETYPDMVAVPTQELTHISRMIYWQNPERIQDIEHFLVGDICAIEDLPVYQVTADTVSRLSHLYSWFSEKEYPIYYREIISPELKDLCEGLSVVVVKVPDMQPLYLEEQLKATGGTRLQSVPKVLGLSTWYDAHGSYFTTPHPFP